MERFESAHYVSVWRALPLRTKASLCFFLPVPAVAIVGIALGLAGFHRFEFLLVPWLAAEMFVAAWLVESVVARIRDLTDLAGALREGNPPREFNWHSWELNNLNQAIESLASRLEQQHSASEECRTEGQRLFEESPGPCLEAGRDGQIVRANGAAGRFLGFAVEELLGRTVAEIFPAEPARHGPADANALPEGAGTTAAYEREHTRRDGTRVLAGIQETPLYDGSGTLTGIRYHIVDRTARLEAAAAAAEWERLVQAKEEERAVAVAAAAEAREARSRFLSNISSDLRVPLNSIVGFAELMVDGRIGPLSADHRDCAADILSSARHLSGVIDQLLDVARTELARPAVTRESVRLEAIVYNARYVLQVLDAQQRGVRIDVHLDPKLREVPADPFRLKRLVTSYLAWAVRSAPEGGHVLVRTATEGAAAFRLEVEVSPEEADGGIARAEVAPEPAEDPELALASRLVEEQGGRAGSRRPSGRGWILFAILPTAPGVAIPEPGPQKVPAPREDAPADAQPLDQLVALLEQTGAPAAAGLTVMVASRTSGELAASLAAAGFQTAALHDLRRTIDLAAREQPAAVVVDIDDLGIDGYRSVLRALRSVGLSVPVLGYPCAEVVTDSGSRTSRLPGPTPETRPRLLPGPGRRRSA